ncbi:MAG: DUF2156 domain-containing protein, partial [Candidatus Omnitrophica bacterium]|nr:DUF2156 domain-containing protein [Candidatus Omnitrophota bacterium]
CLLLHKQWVSRRRQKVADPAYRWMLSDSFSSHKLAMDNFRKLGLIGYVLKSKKEVIGYTFGFRLNPDTFCIMLEVCDSGCKGSSEFIFSGFCSRLSGYKYINTMDDCGLPNLRKSKLSYRPLAEVSNYIIQRKQEA